MILISAGHYPDKQGACFEGFCEHEEAKFWSLLIADFIGNDALPVPTGFLNKKVKFINANSPVIAVEIHFNSFKIWEDANRDGIVTDDELENAGTGCETLYYPDSEKGAYLASEVQSSIAPSLFKDRGIKEGWYRMNKTNGPDFFLARTRCPSIIIEPEFIHHVGDIKTKRRQACELISESLIKVHKEFR